MGQRDQPQTRMRRREAAQPPSGIVVLIADPYRKVQHRQIVIDPGSPQHRLPPHSLADFHLNCGQIGIGGPQTAAVSDRDREDLGNTSGEGDPPVIRRSEWRADVGGDIYAPVTPVPSDRRKAAYHLTGDRRSKTGAQIDGNQKDRHD